MKKLKIVVLFSCTLLLTFCKKSDNLQTKAVETTTHSFEELKVIAKTDTNINNALQATHQLYLIKLASLTVQPTKKITTLSSTADLEKYFQNVKSKEDMVNALQSAGFANADKVVEQISVQINNIRELVTKYPEIKSLSKDQLKELLAIQMDIKAKNNENFNFQRIASIGLNLVNGNCMYSFNSAFNGCESNYNYSMLAIWSAVAYTSVETGGLSSGGGLIGSAIAYAQWNDCVDLASADFANCMGTVS